GWRGRREGERWQLADDRARLDRTVLVLVAGSIELERPHVPGRAGDLPGAVADATVRAVPVRRLGEVASPGQEDGGAGRTEADDDVCAAVSRRRAAMDRGGDRLDGAAPDGEPPGSRGVGLGAVDREPVHCGAVAGEGTRGRP